MTKLRARYMKERRRAQSTISRMKRAGYDTSNITLPSIPKRITQGSINRLQGKFSNAKLYEKATYTMPSGEVVSGKVAKVRRRWKTPAKSTPVVQPNINVSEAKVPAFTPSVEDSISEWDFLVSKIESLIERIPDKPIPDKSAAVSAICSSEFSRFVSEISDEEKPEAVVELRSIVSDGILNYDVYESDQIAEAKAWGYSLQELASHIHSEVVRNIGQQLISADEEEWYNPDDTELSNQLIM